MNGEANAKALIEKEITRLEKALVKKEAEYNEQMEASIKVKKLRVNFIKSKNNISIEELEKLIKEEKKLLKLRKKNSQKLWDEKFDLKQKITQLKDHLH